MYFMKVATPGSGEPSEIEHVDILPALWTFCQDLFVVKYM